MHCRPENVNWDTPAGRKLDTLARQLPPTPVLQITVFGSAALQLLVRGDFLSADVDLFATTDLKEFVRAHHLGEASPAWRSTCAIRSRFARRSIGCRGLCGFIIPFTPPSLLIGPPQVLK